MRVLIVVVALLIPSFALGEDIVPVIPDACVSKTGKIRLVGPQYKRQNCKRGETPINLPAIVPPKQLYVVDGNGQVLGLPVEFHDVNFSQTLSVYLPAQDVIVSFRPEFGLLVEWELEYNTLQHVYLTVDCTGDPYTYFDNTSQYAYSTDGTIENVFVLPVDAVFSELRIRSIAGSGDCREVDYMTYVAPLQKVDLPFTVPLASPVHLEYR